MTKYGNFFDICCNFFRIIESLKKLQGLSLSCSRGYVKYSDKMLPGSSPLALDSDLLLRSV